MILIFYKNKHIFEILNITIFSNSKYIKYYLKLFFLFIGNCTYFPLNPLYLKDQTLELKYY